jgi:hypothetical protein
VWSKRSCRIPQSDRYRVSDEASGVSTHADFVEAQNDEVPLIGVLGSCAYNGRACRGSNSAVLVNYGRKYLQNPREQQASCGCGAAAS